MSAPSDSDLQQEWLSFIQEPGAYVDSTHLAACFDGAVSAALCSRLTACRRLQGRMSALVFERFQLVPADAGACLDADRTIALLPAKALSRLALGSGAIYWSEAIAGVVLSETVDMLLKALGEPIWTLALTHRELAGPARMPDPVDTLTDRIAEDGWRCLAAWRHAQPEGVAMRVRLKLPPNPILDEIPPSPFDRLGPAIVRQAASADLGG